MTTALPPRPAKFTAPSAGKLVARPRLFARLDTACRLPLVWIGATPGAGKTSLLASYLQQAGRPCIWIRLDADDARGDRFPELLARAIGSPRPAGRPAATGAQAATTRQALRAALERLPATAALDQRRTPRSLRRHPCCPVVLLGRGAEVGNPLLRRQVPRPR